jgi:hypothetical protein
MSALLAPIPDDHFVGWVGVDLDGTLAEYDGWRGLDHIGPPVRRMVARIKQWLAAGVDVRIFTARAGVSRASDVMIQDYTELHVGARLPVTNVKDFTMSVFYDDRARQVEFNTGAVVGVDF